MWYDLYILKFIVNYSRHINMYEEQVLIHSYLILRNKNLPNTLEFLLCSTSKYLLMNEIEIIVPVFISFLNRLFIFK